MKNYRIEKSYEGFPSKTKKNYELHNFLISAITSLEITANLWKKNFGIIKYQSSLKLIVEEPDGSNVITFQIFENN